ncbi:MAG: hypothetical protein R3A12_11725 [Ignavibacteria bacterium]
MKTTNGGNSFIKINSGSVRYISDIDFIDNNTGWYSSGEKENFQDNQWRKNWFVPHIDSFSAGVGAVQFVNSGIGLAFTYDNKILTSSDGGTTWSETRMAQEIISTIYLLQMNLISGRSEILDLLTDQQTAV